MVGRRITKKRWKIGSAQNVIISVIVWKRILKIVTVKIVSVNKEKRTKLMNKIFLILALFALSACSVGKKCVVTDEGNVVSSYVWFYKDKPTELDKMNCF